MPLSECAHVFHSALILSGPLVNSFAVPPAISERLNPVDIDGTDGISRDIESLKFESRDRDSRLRFPGLGALELKDKDGAICEIRICRS